jgi:hypothetical protein
MNRLLAFFAALMLSGAAAAADATSATAQQQAAGQAQMKEEQRLQAMTRNRQLRDMRSAKLQAAGVPRREADEAAKTQAGYEARLKTATQQNKPKTNKSAGPKAQS